VFLRVELVRVGLFAGRMLLQSPKSTA